MRLNRAIAVAGLGWAAATVAGGLRRAIGLAGNAAETAYLIRRRAQLAGP